MDRPGPLAWPTRQERNFYPKTLCFPQKTNFQTKNFSRLFERTGHLPHSPSSNQKIHFYQISYIYLQYPIYHTQRRNFLYILKKNFLRLSEKTKFLQTKIISDNYRKTKNFLYMSEKLFPYTFTKKLKGLILDGLRMQLRYILAKLKRVFNKLERVLVCARSYIKPLSF